MIVTGLAFAGANGFWMLLVIAFVGTLNPSSGDVSVFLPTEQALLPGTVPDAERTAQFARYALIGSLVAAFGALCAGVPEWIAARVGASAETALRWTFVGYSVLGVIIFVRYRSLSPAVEPKAEAPAVALGPSRGTCTGSPRSSPWTLGGGFAITALVVLWLQRRFELSIAISGVVFFWAGLLSAFSALHRPPRAPDRTRPDDGVHPPPGQRLPDHRRVDAERAARDRRPVDPLCFVADGCPGPHVW